MEKVPKKHKKAKHVSREQLLSLTKEVRILRNSDETSHNLYGTVFI